MLKGFKMTQLVYRFFSSQHLKTYAGLIRCYGEMGCRESESMLDARVFHCFVKERMWSRGLWTKHSALISLESCPSLPLSSGFCSWPEVTAQPLAEVPSTAPELHSCTAFQLHCIRLLLFVKELHDMALCFVSACSSIRNDPVMTGGELLLNHSQP